LNQTAPIISVFGSSQVSCGSPAYEEARVLGGLLARAGLTVCSGGYGGTMEAVSRGAKEAGGAVIGVTTSWFAHLQANAWVDKEVRTSTFPERLQKLIEMGQGYLAMQGGIGTLTEISTVWSMLQTRSIPPRPFVLLCNPWQQLLQFCTDALIIRPSDFDYLQLTSTPEDAVRAVVRSLQGRDTQLP
jgi:uncharacterized protein (TIGR00730 family)